MTERRVCTVEYDQAESLAMLHIARLGTDLMRTFDEFEWPAGTNARKATDALQKLTRAYTIEADSGGAFDKDLWPGLERGTVERLTQAPEWLGNR